MSLDTKAVLVQLNISQWTARKYDKRVTQEVSDKHNTVGDVGRYNKALLPDNDLLKRIQKKSTAIRTEYYANTLGWGVTDGIQLLPSANYMDFMEQFREHRIEWQGLVDEFMSQYMHERTISKLTLGDMYNESDYPEEHELRSKFAMDITVLPVPSDDFRVEIGSDEMERIADEVRSQVEGAYQSSIKEIWQRLYDKVEAMNKKLSDPKAVFRNTLTENLSDVCDLLTRMNINDDPDLESIRQQVDSELTRNHPDALRNDPIKRREVADKSKDIMSKMNVFMEGL